MKNFSEIKTVSGSQLIDCENIKKIKNADRMADDVLHLMILLDVSESMKNYIPLLRNMTEQIYGCKNTDLCIIGICSDRIEIVKNFTGNAEIITDIEKNLLNIFFEHTGGNISPLGVLLSVAGEKFRKRCGADSEKKAIIICSDFLPNDYSKTDAFESPYEFVSAFTDFSRFITETNTNLYTRPFGEENPLRRKWLDILRGQEQNPEISSIKEIIDKSFVKNTPKVKIKKPSLADLLSR